MTAQPHPILIQYRQDAYLLALRIVGNPADAEDVVQEASLSLIHNATPLPSAEEGRCWFLQAVSFAARSQRRKSHRRQARERRIAGAQGGPTDARRAGESGELKELVHEALKALDQKLRVPVSLRYEQGLTYAEAAQILEVPENTLRVHVMRGLEALRAALARKGYTVMPAALTATLAEGFGIQTPAPLTAALEHLVRTGELPARSARTAASLSSKQAAAAGLSLLGKALACCAVLGCAALAFLYFRPSGQPPSAAALPAPASSGSAPEAADVEVPDPAEYADGPVIYQDEFELIAPLWQVCSIRNDQYRDALAVPGVVSNPFSPFPPNRTRALLLDSRGREPFFEFYPQLDFKRPAFSIEFEVLVEKAGDPAEFLRLTPFYNPDFMPGRVLPADVLLADRISVPEVQAAWKKLGGGGQWVRFRKEVIRCKPAGERRMVFTTNYLDGHLVQASLRADTFTGLAALSARNSAVWMDHFVMRELRPRGR